MSRNVWLLRVETVRTVRPRRHGRRAPRPGDLMMKENMESPFELNRHPTETVTAPGFVMMSNTAERL